MTAATLTCAQPGCGGKIEDGYCDVCGLAASSAPASSAPVTPSAAANVRRSAAAPAAEQYSAARYPFAVS